MHKHFKNLNHFHRYSFKGISSLVDEPSKASSYIEPLLDFAALKIPEHKHKETPLYILATAGMRMLSTADQESILDDLRVDIPLKYNFHFMASHVEVITGKQEGKYAKYTLKLMKNAFDMIINPFSVCPMYP